MLYSSFRRRPEAIDRLTNKYWIPGLRYATAGTKD